MRLVIQRVIQAQLWADEVFCGRINTGLVVFTGIARDDRIADADYLAAKITAIRIFEDTDGKLNRDVSEAGGAVMIVPNFTLYGSTAKGKRPSFDRAAKPEVARPLYEYFVSKVRESGLSIVSGVFQADMRVLVDNNGPVTLICDSPRVIA